MRVRHLVNDAVSKPVASFSYQLTASVSLFHQACLAERIFIGFGYGYTR